MTTTAPSTTGAATGPRWFLTNLVHVRVTPEESKGRLGIVEMVGTRGEMPPLHVHREEDETFIVLEGEMTLHMAGGASATVRAGEVGFAPRGVPHVYRVESETARWLAVSTPGGFASFVLAASDVADEETLPPADRPVDVDRLMSAAVAHGIEIMAPPGAMP